MCIRDRSHGDAIVFLAKYLLGTKDKDLMFDPHKYKSMKLFVDTYFSGHWYPSMTEDDPSMAKSTTGYGILFASCPLLWVSKLQTCISLSTCENEYVALSQ
eukprot:9500113-Ditylum_brightwellii.AAC.1